MRKEIVLIQQEVLLEYENEQERKDIIKALKKYPNSMSVGGAYSRFSKRGKPIKILYTKNRKPPKE